MNFQRFKERAEDTLGLSFFLIIFGLMLGASLLSYLVFWVVGRYIWFNAP